MTIYSLITIFFLIILYFVLFNKIIKLKKENFNLKYSLIKDEKSIINSIISLKNKNKNEDIDNLNKLVLLELYSSGLKFNNNELLYMFSLEYMENGIFEKDKQKSYRYLLLSSFYGNEKAIDKIDEIQNANNNIYNKMDKMLLEGLKMELYENLKKEII